MILNKIIYKGSKILRMFGYNFNENNNLNFIKMKSEINKVGKIKFSIEYYNNNLWVAESININGIITGGNNYNEINQNIKDAIFTYFQIPPYLCIDSFLKFDNEISTETNHYAQKKFFRHYTVAMD